MNYRMDALRGLWGRTFSNLISAAGPWKTMEFPTASGPSAKDASREVSMSPVVPKVQRPGEDQMAPAASGSLERTEGTDRRSWGYMDHGLTHGAG